LSDLFPNVPCPNCGITLRYCVPVLGKPEPDPGDVVICGACVGVFIFTESKILCAVTREDLQEVDIESLEAILHAQHAALSVKAGKN
jgi:hypothetical protein